jgi:CheY-like chemotaxis protein
MPETTRAPIARILMVEDNGLEVTQRIRARCFGRCVPIIAPTAHATAADREICLSAGCNDFETKPIEFERLFGKILSHINVEDGSR